MATFTIGEAVKFGWKTTKEKFLFLVGLVIVIMVAGNLGQIVAGLLGIEDGFGVAILSIAAFVVQGVIQLGAMRILINIVDGKPVSYQDLWSQSNKLLMYIGASLLYGLAVVAGFIALIIPGIIIALALGYYVYLIVDKNLGIIESLKMSAQITKGNRWNIFGLGLVLALINILGILCLGIGLLVTVPISMVAHAYVYRKLTSGREVIVPEVTAVQPPVVNS